MPVGEVARDGAPVWTSKPGRQIETRYAEAPREERHPFAFGREEPERRVREDVVERQEPRARGKRRPWAAIPTVRLAELGIEPLRGEVIELGVVTRGDHRRVVPGHQLVREAHHGLAAADAGEGRELSAQEVATVERRHRQKAGLARRVPERLDGS